VINAIPTDVRQISHRGLARSSADEGTALNISRYLKLRVLFNLCEEKTSTRPKFRMAAPAPAGAGGNLPDFVRYYLQFPPVTRSLLTLILLTSVSLQFNLISRYSLYSGFLGSLLRFFDAGWGIWFLMTCIVSMYLI
jgi:hypothetical protein